MRMLRLSVAATVMLGLLLGSTGAAVAQEPVVATGPENTWVTLERWPDACVWGSPAPGSTEGEGDGFEWLRGFQSGCEVTFSDPRVSGTLTQTWNEDWYETGKARGSLLAWGQEELEGPEGAWSGWFHQVGDPEMENDVSFHVMTGNGAYEGLTFIWERSFDRDSIRHEGQGFIYEGAPPPVSVPAE